MRAEFSSRYRFLLMVVCVGYFSPAMPAFALPRATSGVNVPANSPSTMPSLLSETGVFKDLRALAPADGILPYALVVPFWSDGAEKSRWIFLPGSENGDSLRRHLHRKKIGYSVRGEWKFPEGTILIKTFSIATNETEPNSLRRLETRFIVCTDSTGGVFGVTYKWRADGSDADLLATNLTESISIETAKNVRTQAWYFPSREDCMQCHARNAGGVLGIKTRQLNCDFTYPNGATENQLLAWSRAGLLDTNLSIEAVRRSARLAAVGDLSRSLEDRARSYLDANCAQCHRPGGTVAYFDARYDTALGEQGLIDGRLLFDERIDGARVIVPNDIWRSILLMRLADLGGIKMPPLAHQTPDTNGIALIREWIQSLPGEPTLPPPQIFPNGGNFEKPVTIALEAEPGAAIRYTLDGTVPGKSDLHYEMPIRLIAPTIVRAKAFKNGFKQSITAQDIFIVAN